MRWYTLLISLLLFAGCSTTNATCHGCQPPRKLQPRVTFEISQSKQITISVELACTPKEREQGLMFRKSMPEHSGMLFLFPDEQQQSFWMKNTYIPLDMIHLNKDKEIVGIIENATPHTLTPRRISAPSQYVIEVNAFFARKHGIHIGQRVKFIDIPEC